jgi:ADP-heptose:LPS heptosyltransferase
VLIGGNKEALLAKTLTYSNQSDRVINTAGQISLADLPALIERLTVFVGVDSGVTYMADTLGIPMVYLPGPANPKDQGPIRAKRITLEKPLPCAPCSRVFVTPKTCATGTHECIESFTSTDIANAVVILLKEIDHG